jgi:hypothetical protein
MIDASDLSSPAAWAAHSRMSDPLGCAGAFERLPPDVAALSAIVQGVLVHLDCLAAFGLEADAGISRATLPIAERLGEIFAMDSRPLAFRRPPAQRSKVTCRDFALMLCAMLRSKGIPARLRCGFADYLGEWWEDHWLCEYWAAREGRWRLADSTIDEAFKHSRAIAFDPTDVPRSSFLRAGEAWLSCRTGGRRPERFGHKTTTGMWFIHVNVMRDHYAFNNLETSAWDAWRAAEESQRVIANFAAIDAMAAQRLGPLIETTPGWLA